MKVIMRFLVSVIPFVMFCLLGCIHVEAPKKPLVDVDIGTSNNGGNNSLDKTDNDYADQLKIANLKVRRITDGNNIDADISGSIKNNGKKTVTYIKAKVIFYDEDNDDVDDTDVKLFEHANLRPGGTRDFTRYVKDVDKDWKGGEGSVRIKIKKVKVRR